MQKQKYIPFGRTGSICLIDSPLPPSPEGEKEANLNSRIENYRSKNINRVFIISSKKESHFFEPLIERLQDKQITVNFIQYTGNQEDVFNADVELLDSIYRIQGKRNFAFLSTETEIRDIYVLICKALLYLNNNCKTYDVATYLQDLNWEKTELKYITSFQNYLKKDYYLYRELAFQIPTVHTRTEKVALGEKKEISGLVFDSLDSAKESLILNDDGSFKDISFNLSSLHEAITEKSFEKKELPDNHPGNEFKNQDISDLLKDINTKPEPGKTAAKIDFNSISGIIDLDEILSEDDRQEPVEEPKLVEIREVKKAPSKRAEVINLDSLIEEDIDRNLIDFSKTSVYTPLPEIEEELENLPISTVEEAEEIHHFETLQHEEDRDSSPSKTDSLIDIESLIDSNLEKDLIYTNPQIQLPASNFIPEKKEDKKETKVENEEDDELPSFDVEGLITEELAEEEGDLQPVQVTDVTEPKQEKLEEKEEKIDLESEDELMDINQLIDDELEPESFADDDFLSEPTEKNLDKLINKEIKS